MQRLDGWQHQDMCTCLGGIILSPLVLLGLIILARLFGGVNYVVRAVLLLLGVAVSMAEKNSATEDVHSRLCGHSYLPLFRQLWLHVAAATFGLLSLVV